MRFNLFSVFALIFCIHLGLIYLIHLMCHRVLVLKMNCMDHNSVCLLFDLKLCFCFDSFSDSLSDSLSDLLSTSLSDSFSLMTCNFLLSCFLMSSLFINSFFKSFSLHWNSSEMCSNIE